MPTFVFVSSLGFRYDLAAGSLFNEAALLKTIAQYAQSLFSEQGIALDSFLIDDGWDNRTHGLWEFHRFVVKSRALLLVIAVLTMVCRLMWTLTC